MPPMPILIPMLALVLWSFVMWAWLYATRIPAIVRLKLKYDPRLPAAEFLDKIPPETRWKADNYNHLMEQPTLFYAVCLALAVLGQGWGLNEMLAWAYVVLRIIHSLIQATVNVVSARFAVFTVASIVLLTMTVRAFLAALA
jgi:hypothetical protein